MSTKWFRKLLHTTIFILLFAPLISSLEGSNLEKPEIFNDEENYLDDEEKYRAKRDTNKEAGYEDDFTSTMDPFLMNLYTEQPSQNEHLWMDEYGKMTDNSVFNGNPGNSEEHLESTESNFGEGGVYAYTSDDGLAVSQEEEIPTGGGENWKKIVYKIVKQRFKDDPHVKINSFEFKSDESFDESEESSENEANSERTKEFIKLRQKLRVNWKLHTYSFKKFELSFFTQHLEKDLPTQAILKKFSKEEIDMLWIWIFQNEMLNFKKFEKFYWSLLKETRVPEKKEWKQEVYTFVQNFFSGESNITVLEAPESFSSSDGDGDGEAMGDKSGSKFIDRSHEFTLLRDEIRHKWHITKKSQSYHVTYFTSQYQKDASMRKRLSNFTQKEIYMIWVWTVQTFIKNFTKFEKFYNKIVKMSEWKENTAWRKNLQGLAKSFFDQGSEVTLKSASYSNFDEEEISEATDSVRLEKFSSLREELRERWEIVEKSTTIYNLSYFIKRYTEDFHVQTLLQKWSLNDVYELWMWTAQDFTQNFAKFDAYYLRLIKIAEVKENNNWQSGFQNFAKSFFEEDPNVSILEGVAGGEGAGYGGYGGDGFDFEGGSKTKESSTAQRASNFILFRKVLRERWEITRRSTAYKLSYFTKRYERDHYVETLFRSWTKKDLYLLWTYTVQESGTNFAKYESYFSKVIKIKDGSVAYEFTNLKKPLADEEDSEEVKTERWKKIVLKIIKKRYKQNPGMSSHSHSEQVLSRRKSAERANLFKKLRQEIRERWRVSEIEESGFQYDFFQGKLQQDGHVQSLLEGWKVYDLEMLWIWTFQRKVTSFLEFEKFYKETLTKLPVSKTMSGDSGVEQGDQGIKENDLDNITKMVILPMKKPDSLVSEESEEKNTSSAVPAPKNEVELTEKTTLQPSTETSSGQTETGEKSGAVAKPKEKPDGKSIRVERPPEDLEITSEATAAKVTSEYAPTASEADTIPFPSTVASQSKATELSGTETVTELVAESTTFLASETATAAEMATSTTEDKTGTSTESVQISNSPSELITSTMSGEISATNAEESTTEAATALPLTIASSVETATADLIGESSSTTESSTSGLRSNVATESVPVSTEEKPTSIANEISTTETISASESFTELPQISSTASVDLTSSTISEETSKANAEQDTSTTTEVALGTNVDRETTNADLITSIVPMTSNTESIPPQTTAQFVGESTSLTSETSTDEILSQTTAATDSSTEPLKISSSTSPDELISSTGETSLVTGKSPVEDLTTTSALEINTMETTAEGAETATTEGIDIPFPKSTSSSMDASTGVVTEEHVASTTPKVENLEHETSTEATSEMSFTTENVDSTAEPVTDKQTEEAATTESSPVEPKTEIISSETTSRAISDAIEDSTTAEISLTNSNSDTTEVNTTPEGIQAATETIKETEPTSTFSSSASSSTDALTAEVVTKEQEAPATPTIENLEKVPETSSEMTPGMISTSESVNSATDKQTEEAAASTSSPEEPKTEIIPAETTSGVIPDQTEADKQSTTEPELVTPLISSTIPEKSEIEATTEPQTETGTALPLTTELALGRNVEIETTSADLISETSTIETLKTSSVTEASTEIDKQTEEARASTQPSPEELKTTEIISSTEAIADVTEEEKFTTELSPEITTQPTEPSFTTPEGMTTSPAAEAAETSTDGLTSTPGMISTETAGPSETTSSEPLPTTEESKLASTLPTNEGSSSETPATSEAMSITTSKETLDFTTESPSTTESGTALPLATELAIGRNVEIETTSADLISDTSTIETVTSSVTEGSTETVTDRQTETATSTESSPEELKATSEILTSEAMPEVTEESKVSPEITTEPIEVPSASTEAAFSKATTEQTSTGESTSSEKVTTFTSIESSTNFPPTTEIESLTTQAAIGRNVELETTAVVIESTTTTTEATLTTEGPTEQFETSSSASTEHLPESTALSEAAPSTMNPTTETSTSNGESLTTQESSTNSVPEVESSFTTEVHPITSSVTAAVEQEQTTTELETTAQQDEKATSELILLTTESTKATTEEKVEETTTTESSKPLPGKGSVKPKLRFFQKGERALKGTTKQSRIETATVSDVITIKLNEVVTAQPRQPDLGNDASTKTVIQEASTVLEGTTTEASSSKDSTFSSSTDLISEQSATQTTFTTEESSKLTTELQIETTTFSESSSTPSTEILTTSSTDLDTEVPVLLSTELAKEEETTTLSDVITETSLNSEASGPTTFSTDSKSETGESILTAVTTESLGHSTDSATPTLSTDLPAVDTTTNQLSSTEETPTSTLAVDEPTSNLPIEKNEETTTLESEVESSLGKEIETTTQTVTESSKVDELTSITGESSTLSATGSQETSTTTESLPTFTTETFSAQSESTEQTGKPSISTTEANTEPEIFTPSIISTNEGSTEVISTSTVSANEETSESKAVTSTVSDTTEITTEEVPASTEHHTKASTTETLETFFSSTAEALLNTHLTSTTPELIASTEMGRVTEVDNVPTVSTTEASLTASISETTEVRTTPEGAETATMEEINKEITSTFSSSASSSTDGSTAEVVTEAQEVPVTPKIENLETEHETPSEMTPSTSSTTGSVDSATDTVTDKQTEEAAASTSSPEEPKTEIIPAETISGAIPDQTEADKQTTTEPELVTPLISSTIPEKSEIEATTVPQTETGAALPLTTDLAIGRNVEIETTSADILSDTSTIEAVETSSVTGDSTEPSTETEGKSDDVAKTKEKPMGRSFKVETEEKAVAKSKEKPDGKSIRVERPPEDLEITSETTAAKAAPESTASEADTTFFPSTAASQSDATELTGTEAVTESVAESTTFLAGDTSTEVATSTATTEDKTETSTESMQISNSPSELITSTISGETLETNTVQSTTVTATALPLTTDLAINVEAETTTDNLISETSAAPSSDTTESVSLPTEEKFTSITSETSNTAEVSHTESTITTESSTELQQISTTASVELISSTLSEDTSKTNEEQDTSTTTEGALGTNVDVEPSTAASTAPMTSNDATESIPSQTTAQFEGGSTFLPTETSIDAILAQTTTSATDSSTEPLKLSNTTADELISSTIETSLVTEQGTFPAEELTTTSEVNKVATTSESAETATTEGIDTFSTPSSSSTAELVTDYEAPTTPNTESLQNEHETSTEATSGMSPTIGIVDSTTETVTDKQTEKAATESSPEELKTEIISSSTTSGAMPDATEKDKESTPTEISLTTSNSDTTEVNTTPEGIQTATEAIKETETTSTFSSSASSFTDASTAEIVTEAQEALATPTIENLEKEHETLEMTSGMSSTTETVTDKQTEEAAASTQPTPEEPKTTKIIPVETTSGAITDTTEAVKESITESSPELPTSLITSTIAGETSEVTVTTEPQSTTEAGAALSLTTELAIGRNLDIETTSADLISETSTIETVVTSVTEGSTETVTDKKSGDAAASTESPAEELQTTEILISEAMPKMTEESTKLSPEITSEPADSFKIQSEKTVSTTEPFLEIGSTSAKDATGETSTQAEEEKGTEPTGLTTISTEITSEMSSEPTNPAENTEETISTVITEPAIALSTEASSLTTEEFTEVTTTESGDNSVNAYTTREPMPILGLTTEQPGESSVIPSTTLAAIGRNVELETTSISEVESAKESSTEAESSGIGISTEPLVLSTESISNGESTTLTTLNEETTVQQDGSVILTEATTDFPSTAESFEHDVTTTEVYIIGTESPTEEFQAGQTEEITYNVPSISTGERISEVISATESIASTGAKSSEVKETKSTSPKSIKTEIINTKNSSSESESDIFTIATKHMMKQIKESKSGSQSRASEPDLFDILYKKTMDTHFKDEDLEAGGYQEEDHLHRGGESGVSNGSYYCNCSCPSPEDKLEALNDLKEIVNSGHGHHVDDDLRDKTFHFSKEELQIFISLIETTGYVDVDSLLEGEQVLDGQAGKNWIEEIGIEQNSESQPSPGEGENMESQPSPDEGENLESQPSQGAEQSMENQPFPGAEQNLESQPKSDVQQNSVEMTRRKRSINKDSLEDSLLITLSKNQAKLKGYSNGHHISDHKYREKAKSIKNKLKDLIIQEKADYHTMPQNKEDSSKKQRKHTKFKRKFNGNKNYYDKMSKLKSVSDLLRLNYHKI